MGLLDDAIREHLELKRRHGADPGEVARLEREAFGPLRREAGEAAVAQEVRPVAVPESDLEYEDDDLEYEADVLYEDAAPAGPEPPLETAHEPLVESVHHEPPPEPVHHEPPPAPRDAGQQATAEFSIEDEGEERPEDEPEEGEELLEETPEFLQETPEHDRLWFEQRPPRDFDF